jgi:hypothetical protein
MVISIFMSKQLSSLPAYSSETFDMQAFAFIRAMNCKFLFQTCSLYVAEAADGAVQGTQ